MPLAAALMKMSIAAASYSVPKRPDGMILRSEVGRDWDSRYVADVCGFVVTEVSSSSSPSMLPSVMSDGSSSKSDMSSSTCLDSCGIVDAMDATGALG